MAGFEQGLSQEIKRRKASKKAVSDVVDGLFKKRAALPEDEEALSSRLRGIKEKSIASLDGLVAQAKASLEKNGVKVVLAKDAAEAREACLAAMGSGKLVVKSKSNTCKEIGLELLAKEGKEIVETDTGDFSVQILSEEGIHQVLPAMHIPPEAIAQALSKRLKAKVSSSPADITHAMARHLRQKIIEADAGITGANAITASGEIVLLENEGNISLVSRVPKKHIIIAGIEKVVPTLDDAMAVVKCATLWGTGQSWPAYVSIITGPSTTADIENELVSGAQGAYEVTLILVDNGRKELARKHPEILYCINCGACNSLCPPFRQVFSFFGGSYPGPKGIVYLALSKGGKQNYLCTLCKSCKLSCPAKIDLPESIRKIRGDLKMESDSGMIGKIREHGNPFGKVEKGKMPDKLYCC